MSKLEELLQESVREIESRKSKLLKECEQIEKDMRDKENEANDRIKLLEDECHEYVAKQNKAADDNLKDILSIRKSLEGSDETLKSVSDELIRLDAQRASFNEDKKLFEAHMVKENEKLDLRFKEIELREAKLSEV